jgi:sugar phosphate isomerase/epimerase
MNEPALIGSYWTLAGMAYPHDKEDSPFDFADRAREAARAGFKGIGIWHSDLEKILQKYTHQDMKKILDDNGLFIELEFLTDFFYRDERREWSDKMRKLLLDAAEALDAPHIKAGDFAGAPCPMPQMIEEFAKLCADAKERGTKILYEFIPNSVVNTLEKARQLVEGAAADNGGVIVDLWHVVSIGITYDQLATFPAKYILGVELNDGPLKMPADWRDETINHRRLCGEGEFDIQGFLKTLDKLGYKGPFGVEVLSAKLRELPLRQCCEDVYRTTMAQFKN